MAAAVTSCASPECFEPGTSFCGSCGLVKYCSRTCQTADWPHHKKECQGHLRKLGIKHLEKAKGFRGERNFVQSLHSSELALTKLKKLHPRPLEVVEIIDFAMTIKYDSLSFTNQKKEALECAKERYSLWAAGYMRNPGMLEEQYEEAVLIASTAYDMITNDIDNIIPEDRRQQFHADGASMLAQATYKLAESGGMAPEEEHKAGKEAIAHARKALEIHTQLHGAESNEIAVDVGVLADILRYFNGVDDDDILRLYEQAIAIFSRVEGSLSANVAMGEDNLGKAYYRRAVEALDANDLDRYVSNLELALTHYREAAQIYKVINHVVATDRVTQCVVEVERSLRLTQIQISASVAIRGCSMC